MSNPTVSEPAVRDEPLQLHRLTADAVLSLVCSAAGALALVWLLYERLLPFTGLVGFWLCWYVVFLLLYGLVSAARWGRRVLVDRVAGVALATGGLLVLVVVVAQIGYTVYRGTPALRHGNFFTETMGITGPLDPLTSGGVLHALIGSLEQLGLATLFSVPLGVLAALFLAEIGGSLARPVRVIVEAMTALPEIIAGLFIYAVVILTLGLEQSGFAASLALTVMMIPIVTRASEVMLRLVPNGLREASYALGASQWRTVWNVVLPTARSGLGTAVVLAMARAVGETAPVLLASGFTKELNSDPFTGPQLSLPLYIWNYVRYPQPDMVARAFGAGLALMIAVLALFVLARIIGGGTPGELTRRQQRRMARDAAAYRHDRQPVESS
ncbi:phosphate ABC transporter permease PstA [Dactylosporangium sp. CA-233914]|uniref:phosphate ABC transporter permease PstA n=1 Tax=Dactylosporangium sp. CA-233914 TaxID=3239934 RepID=UPI003D8B6505